MIDKEASVPSTHVVEANGNGNGVHGAAGMEVDQEEEL